MGRPISRQAQPTGLRTATESCANSLDSSQDVLFSLSNELREKRCQLRNISSLHCVDVCVDVGLDCPRRGLQDPIPLVDVTLGEII